MLLVGLAILTFVVLVNVIPPDKGWSGREWHSDKDDDE